jgi:hypothetical protein
MLWLMHELDHPADLDQLLQAAASLLGVEQGLFNHLREQLSPKPSGPRALENGNDLTGLVRDLLVRTIGMGIELP